MKTLLLCGGAVAPAPALALALARTHDLRHAMLAKSTFTH